MSLKPLDAGRELIVSAVEGYNFKKTPLDQESMDMERGKGGAVDF